MSLHHDVSCAARSGHKVVTSSVFNTQTFFLKIISRTHITFLPSHHNRYAINVRSCKSKKLHLWREGNEASGGCEKKQRVHFSCHKEDLALPSHISFLHLRIITIYMFVFVFVQNCISYMHMYLSARVKYRLLLVQMFMYSQCLCLCISKLTTTTYKYKYK